MRKREGEREKKSEERERGWEERRRERETEREGGRWGGGGVRIWGFKNKTRVRCILVKCRTPW